MNHSLTTRVVKVGGSLLDFDRLPETLADWLAAQTPAINVLIAGGGKLADEIRSADARFDLGELAAHWICIDLLDITAKLLATMLPSAEWITSLTELQDRIASQSAVDWTSRKIVDTIVKKVYPTWIFSPSRFLREQEQHLPGVVLPHGWCVTSDSIAARIAETLGAEELVLLKSADPPTNTLESTGYVDQHFELACKAVPRIRFVDLRKYQ